MIVVRPTYLLYCVDTVPGENCPVSPTRRIEDHIRSLCKKLVEANDSEEFRTLAMELRASLSEHIGRMRHRLGDYPLATERRSGNSD
jgi:hypothetical protein